MNIYVKFKYICIYFVVTVSVSVTAETRGRVSALVSVTAVSVQGVTVVVSVSAVTEKTSFGRSLV